MYKNQTWLISKSLNLFNTKILLLTKIIIFLYKKNHILTVAGIDWIWLWSNVRNCKLCNKPILVGIDDKLLNDKCNSTNDVILISKRKKLVFFFVQNQTES